MTHRLVYEGREVIPLPSTFNGDTVDVVTRDGKRHVAVPLSSLDEWLED